METEEITLVQVINGEELIADICNDEEIEFRVNGDADSILHIEDIVERLI